MGNEKSCNCCSRKFYCSKLERHFGHVSYGMTETVDNRDLVEKRLAGSCEHFTTGTFGFRELEEWEKMQADNKFIEERC
jgi:hypothetical protein